MQNTTQEIIEKYYDAFNRQDQKAMIDLLHDDVIHDINQGHRETGKKEFALFLEKMHRYYEENISDLYIMVSSDGKRAAAEFMTNGTYLLTAAGLPKAENQKYALPCGSFFEIKDGKIFRVTVYYNLNEWLRQIEK